MASLTHRGGLGFYVMPVSLCVEVHAMQRPLAAFELMYVPVCDLRDAISSKHLRGFMHST